MSVKVEIKDEPIDDEEFEDFEEELLKPLETSKKQEINTPKPKRKRLAWNEASEAALLEIWPARVEELRKLKKNGKIYAEMAEELRKQGYPYSTRDVQVKLQNFTQRYRKEKPPSSWHQYERVHQIIGGYNPLFNYHQSSTEMMFESFDDPFMASSSSSLPDTPIPAPKSPIRPVSPPPPPTPAPASTPPASSTSTSAFKPARKRGVKNFQTKIFQKFDNLSTDITAYLKKSAENESELIEIERKKACSLEKIAKEQEELRIALISFLNKN